MVAQTGAPTKGKILTNPTDVKPVVRLSGAEASASVLVTVDVEGAPSLPCPCGTDFTPRILGMFFAWESPDTGWTLEKWIVHTDHGDHHVDIPGEAFGEPIPMPEPIKLVAMVMESLGAPKLPESLSFGPVPQWVTDAADHYRPRMRPSARTTDLDVPLVQIDPDQTIPDA